MVLCRSRDNISRRNSLQFQMKQILLLYFFNFFYFRVLATSLCQQQVRKWRTAKPVCHQCSGIRSAQDLQQFLAVNTVQVSNNNFPKLLPNQGAGIDTWEQTAKKFFSGQHRTKPRCWHWALHYPWMCDGCPFWETILLLVFWGRVPASPACRAERRHSFGQRGCLNLAFAVRTSYPSGFLFQKEHSSQMRSLLKHLEETHYDLS